MFKPCDLVLWWRHYHTFVSFQERLLGGQIWDWAAVCWLVRPNLITFTTNINSCQWVSILLLYSSFLFISKWCSLCTNLTQSRITYAAWLRDVAVTIWRYDKETTTYDFLLCVFAMLCFNYINFEINNISSRTFRFMSVEFFKSFAMSRDIFVICELISIVSFFIRVPHSKGKMWPYY